MKRRRKLFALAALALAVLFGGTSVFGITATADVLGDPCSFDAVQVEQTGGAPDWFNEKKGRASTVNLNFAVEDGDWTGATAVRIRLQSLNNGKYLPTDATDNNIALKIGAKSKTSDEIIWSVNKPYSNVKYVYPNGEPGPNLYFILTTIPYFVVPREYTGCVEFSLDGATFERKTETSSEKIWYSESVMEQEPDVSSVRFVSVMFEPLNYDDLVMNFGNIEINVNGTWKTAVDMSKGRLIQKKTEEAWKQALLSMGANEVMLDPDDADKTADEDTTSFVVRKMQATACEAHVDLTSDGICDRCFEVLPHEMWDIDEDGFCDDCGTAFCGAHVDSDGDNLCDLCGHIVDANLPVDGDEKEEMPTEKKSGCKGAFLSPVLALGASVCLLGLRTKQKNLTEGDKR